MTRSSIEIGTQPTPPREIYSISELNSEARVLLEKRFPLIWVEGEISNLARPASGHIYFSLKDEAAQARCAMFKMRNRLVNFQPKNGQQILARVRISLYEARGEFQLIVEHMEETGDGVLRRQFEQLKNQLYEEGLFDEASKQALPVLPARVGVITSPSGAAVRDILSVLKRRFPGLPILVYPVPVQGTEAPQAIVEAIQSAAKRQDCDLLILARGGGSLEDLWAFNNEKVARAINACPIPIVTGIGHEVDFTIADFVADQRAPTPSAAAELISPDRFELIETFSSWQKRLLRAWQGYQQQHIQTLGWLSKQLIHPGQRLQEHTQRLDDLEQRISQAQESRIHRLRSKLDTLQARLLGQSPRQRLQRIQISLDKLNHASQQAILNKLERSKQQLSSISRALDTVSPLATLGRGYAIVQTQTGKVVRKASDLSVNDTIKTRLGSGHLDCRVEAIHED
jgi:exodeoxyribonuclease VII large subunit